jgi:hypothetical protein
MEQNKVYTIKLISGEEIIARILPQEGGVTELIKPRSIAMTGNGGFGMMPWLVSAPDSNVLISDTTIVGAVETGQMVATQYIKQVTGIQV